jgi:hypothetical protein
METTRPMKRALYILARLNATEARRADIATHYKPRVNLWTRRIVVCGHFLADERLDTLQTSRSHPGGDL